MPLLSTILNLNRIFFFSQSEKIKFFFFCFGKMNPTVVAKCLCLALFMTLTRANPDQPFDLGKIVMKLKSAYDDDISELSEDIQFVTSQYLENYFNAYYLETGNKESNYKSSMLSVNGTEIEQDAYGYVTTIEFTGILTFGAPAPSEKLLETLLINAFNGPNLDYFTHQLIMSESLFLYKLRHIIVEVREDFVSEKDLVNPEENSVSNQEGNETGLTKWQSILVYILSVLLGILIAFLGFAVIRCCTGYGKKRVADEPEPVNVKSIDVPKTIQPQQQRQKKKKKKKYGSQKYDQMEDDPLARTPERKRKQTFIKVQRPLSPVRSIVSQDSSKFTYTNYAGQSVMSYNPAGMSMMSNATLVLGNGNCVLSTEQEEQVSQDDSSVLPVAFGHQFPATDSRVRLFRDLSNVVEDIYEDIELVDKDFPPLEVRLAASRNTRKSYSKAPRNHVSRYDAGSFKVPSGRSSRPDKAVSPRYGNAYNTESPRSNHTDESAGNVINDLRDLSLQIDMHRHESRFGGY